VSCMKWALRVLGGGILFNGIYVSFAESINWGVVATFLLGVLLLLWGIFWEKTAEKKAVKNIRNVFVALVCVETVFVTSVAIYGNIDTVTYKEDVLIVLGAGLKGEKITPALKERLDTALEYFEKNPEVLIVVSGGKGSQESITEAEAMSKYLVEKGVPEQQVIREDKSTSTAENMKYSKAILDGIFDRAYKVAFVTNDFHIMRADMLAGRMGFKGATHIHGGLEWYNYVPCYIRETMAMVKSIIFD